MKKLDALERNSAIVFMLNMAGAAINYLSQILMGRSSLSVGSFGTLNAIFSAYTLLSVFATAFTPFITKITADSGNHATLNFQLSKLLRFIFLLCGGLLVLSLTSMPLWGAALKISAYDVVTVSIVLVLSGLFPPIFQGALTGLHLFLQLGIISLLVPLGKLLGVLIMPLFAQSESLQQSAVLLGSMLGAVLTALVGWRIFARHGFRYQARRLTPKNTSSLITSGYGTVFVMNFGLMFFMHSSTLMIRYYYGDVVSGDYSSMQIFAHIAYYVTSSLVTVMLPMLVKKSAAQKSPFSLFKKTLLYTAAASIIIYIPLIFFSQPIIHIFLSDKFAVNTTLMALACGVSFVLSLNTVVANYVYGIEQTRCLKASFIAACIIAATLMFILNNSIVYMLCALCAVGFITFVVNFVYALKHREQEK